MDWIKLEKKYVLQTYKRQNIIFVRGKGKYLWDQKGKRYLDFFSGLSVCNLGHCHPRINRKIHAQVNKLIHTSNLYYITPQIKLAELLMKRSFKTGKMFFSNSGGEANECAIKLARKYGNKVKDGCEIIVFKNSFHGRTLATLTATGQKKLHKGFKPLLSGFKYAEFNNIQSVKRLINKKTCAVIIEPIQGEGGVHPAEKKFLKNLKNLCNKHKLLLIFDEVQCGTGRIGEFFAYQYYGIQPDIITLAKSIANGLPLGVTMIKKKFTDVLSYGDHGSTFGGNMISCAAAVEVVNLVDKKMLSNIRKLGAYFIKRLNELKVKHETINEIRGTGLMIGMELETKCGDIVKECLKNGLIINCTKEKVLRFLPPFIITKSDIDKAMNILDSVIKGRKK